MPDEFAGVGPENAGVCNPNMQFQADIDMFENEVDIEEINLQPAQQEIKRINDKLKKR